MSTEPQTPPIIIEREEPREPARNPSVGVLLVHGLNGSRRDMAQLAHFIAEQGFIAENILLPGHGTRVNDLMRLGWTDWDEAVRKELHALKQRCDLVFIIGHSIGGSLALHRAAHEEVAGIITMCSPIHMFPWMRPLIKLGKYVLPMVPTIREDVNDPDGRSLYTRDVYRWTALWPVDSLINFLPELRRELPRVTCPALIMGSIHDHVIPYQDAVGIYRRISSPDKHLVTFYHSFHVITKDYDREEVFAKALSFIKHQARKAAAQKSA